MEVLMCYIKILHQNFVLVLLNVSVRSTKIVCCACLAHLNQFSQICVLAFKLGSSCYLDLKSTVKYSFIFTCFFSENIFVYATAVYVHVCLYLSSKLFHKRL